MSDDPAKTAEDRRTVSSQEHEQRYVVETLQTEFPRAGGERIKAALERARRDIAPSRSRKRLLNSARGKLR